MQPDQHEDLAFEAENRRRRRMGLTEAALPAWPSEEYWDIAGALHRLALSSEGVTDPMVRAMAQFAFESGQTVGQQARLVERAVGVTAEARVAVMRAMGTREPGEEG